MRQEYNSLLVNALNRVFKSDLSLNNFKWLLTKLPELSCVGNIIPRSRKRLRNGYPVLNQELQNHDPVGLHIHVQVMYGSTQPPPPKGGLTDYLKEPHRDITVVCVTFYLFLSLPFSLVFMNISVISSSPMERKKPFTIHRMQIWRISRSGRV